MEDFVSAPWLRRLITAVLLAILVMLGFQVLDPFIVPIVWAAILGYVSWPGYQWLVKVFRGRGQTTNGESWFLIQAKTGSKRPIRDGWLHSRGCRQKKPPLSRWPERKERSYYFPRLLRRSES